MVADPQNTVWLGLEYFVNIGDSLKKSNFKRQRAHHQNADKKQLGMLASMALWS